MQTKYIKRQFKNKQINYLFSVAPIHNFAVGNS